MPPEEDVVLPATCSAERWRQMLDQLRLARDEEKTPVRHQPHPPGHVVAGSATDQILRLFRDNPLRWYARWQLAELLAPTGQKAIDSALLILRARGDILTRGDSRNSKWLQYGHNPKAIARIAP